VCVNMCGGLGVGFAVFCVSECVQRFCVFWSFVVSVCFLCFGGFVCFECFRDF
jgi:hypothetical protein